MRHAETLTETGVSSTDFSITRKKEPGCVQTRSLSGLLFYARKKEPQLAPKKVTTPLSFHEA